MLLHDTRPLKRSNAISLYKTSCKECAAFRTVCWSGKKKKKIPELPDPSHRLYFALTAVWPGVPSSHELVKYLHVSDIPCPDLIIKSFYVRIFNRVKISLCPANERLPPFCPLSSVSFCRCSHTKKKKKKKTPTQQTSEPQEDWRGDSVGGARRWKGGGRGEEAAQ